MAITPTIQRTGNPPRPVVAAGAGFTVALETNAGSEQGLMSLTVAGKSRSFALIPGGAKQTTWPVFVDPQGMRRIEDWGTANDANSDLVVTVDAGSTPKHDVAKAI